MSAQHAAGAPLIRQAGEVTFSDLFSVIVRYRLHIAIVGIVAMLFSAVDLARTPRKFSSSVTVLPQRPSPTAVAVGQIGWGGQGNDAVQSPAFYVEVINFRTILGQIVDSARIIQPSGTSQSIYDALRITEQNPRIRRESAMGAVSGMVSASADDKIGIVTFRVRAPTADMAVGVAEALLRALIRFNGEVRQTGAAAEREFIDQRRAEIRTELSYAEERLISFLRQNRGGESPDLQFERQRLEAEVNLRRELYLSLSQAYERARIEAVRDTPALSVIDKPERPLGPDPKPGMRGLVLALLGGMVAGVVLAFLLESFRLARAARKRASVTA